MRLRQEHESKRISRYNCVPRSAFCQELVNELKAWIRSWNNLLSALELEELGEGDRYMGCLLMKWVARCTIHAKEDIIALDKGCDKFLNVFLNRWQ
jgi:hypothetical protein